MIDRRRFLGALAVAAIAPFSGAQQLKVWRVGYLSPQSRLDPPYDRAFLQGMSERGYVEGRNLIVEWRFADGHYERLPALAAELVRLNVDVIVASTSPAIRAAQKVTTSIPIVFPATGDPVGSGFVASLARPGGNITGLSNINLDVSAKLLELLMTMLPGLSRVAVLGNPGSSTHTAILQGIQTAAMKTAGLRVLSVEAGTKEEIEHGFVRMTREGANGLIIAGDPFLIQQARQIALLAVQHRLPSITQQPLYAEAGGLMSYGQSVADSHRYAAAYVDRILKGAKPADLPVEQSTKLQLVINGKTAKALGLAIPQALLISADRVIE
jgi:putative ABC transport system substrate-binding protein